eukprot:TRINITY_DN113_c0_g1_i2.p1 TRINITY_DN113_c0_g1~~TRINITY_DN113_c0_g1_i2.p1  ORF type:complete len:545 (+),score=159.30 TRINITY_DN113_c0_g1_i2:92-1636(+)
MSSLSSCSSLYRRSAWQGEEFRSPFVQRVRTLRVSGYPVCRSHLGYGDVAGETVFRLSEATGSHFLRPFLSTLADVGASAAGSLTAAADGTAAAVADSLASAGDAAASASDAAAAATQSSGDWLSGLTDFMEAILKLLEGGLTSLHVPYAYGFSIILLTILVKAATYPLTKKQVESTMAMQSLQPKLKAIQGKYAGDQERIQLETARLYKQAGVNPLAGCLPTLATLPIWIGLYRALSNVANEGVLTEGFFWIPSLAGPTSINNGVSWIFPFVNGVPPLGWGPTAAYLVLPVLLVISQFSSMQLMQPPQASQDPAQQNTQIILKFLPLMIGWFSLSVPSGLSLYWFTNNILSTAQTLYLRQGGGASPALTADGATEIIEVGQARRTSSPRVATATEIEKQQARGERFRQLKEAEVARKEAAKKAAEEASRASAAKAQEEAQRLLQLQQQQQHLQEEDKSLEEHDEGDEEEQEEAQMPGNGAVGQPVATTGSGSSSVPTRRTSRRSKRTTRRAQN